MKTDLDNVKQLIKLDGNNLIDTLLEFPSQFIKAINLIREFFLPPNFPIPRKIILLGNPHTAYTLSSLINNILFNNLSIPLIPHTGYNIPYWADKHTLAFLVCGQEGSKEILNTLRQLINKKIKTIVISPNLQVLEMADNFNLPIINFETAPNTPCNFYLPYFFISILIILERLGFIESNFRRQIDEVIEVLTMIKNECNINQLSVNNQAKKIALNLAGKIPLIYGVKESTEAVALHWKYQFEQISNVLTFYDFFPDVLSQELMIWQNCKSDINNIVPVILFNPSDDDKIIKYQLTLKEIIENKNNGLKVIEVKTKGNSLLACNLSLMYLGDWISLYLLFLK